MHRLVFLSLLLATLAARASAQQPDSAPSGPLTLLEAISLGRRQGVDAAVARLNLRAAEARTGQARADLLPDISGSASITRQRLNLDEFGLPIAGQVGKRRRLVVGLIEDLVTHPVGVFALRVLEP